MHGNRRSLKTVNDVDNSVLYQQQCLKTDTNEKQGLDSQVGKAAVMDATIAPCTTAESYPCGVFIKR